MYVSSDCIPSLVRSSAIAKNMKKSLIGGLTMTRGGRWRIQKKKYKCLEWQSKINLYSKFHKYLTIGGFKCWGKVWGDGEEFKKMPCRMRRLKGCLDGSASTAWDYAGLLCNLYRDAGPIHCHHSQTSQPLTHMVRMFLLLKKYLKSEKDLETSMYTNFFIN